MHKLLEKIILNLQFFGEGASGGDGAGEGSSSAPAVGQQDALETLGVPKEKVEKYRAKKGKPAVNTGTEPAQDAAADQSADDDSVWENAKKNPVINKRMQETVNARLQAFAKKNGDAQSRLDALAPVIELVGRKAGIDVSDLNAIDVKDFVEKVSADPSYYEDLAAEMGTDIETARQIDQRERDATRRENSIRQQEQEQMFRQHIDGLYQQGELLKQQGYNINIDEELNDPWFARVTSPSGGLSVKQAIDAKYHDQMMTAAKQQSVMAARSAVSNSIRSAKGMPNENGTVARASAPTTTKPYSQMSAEEKAYYYKQLTGQDRRKR